MAKKKRVNKVDEDIPKITPEHTPENITPSVKSKLSLSNVPKLVIFVIIFAVISSYLLFRSFALTPPPALSDSPPKPFINQPERGLVWAGLKSNLQGKCGHALEMVKDGKVLGCTHGPDPAPAGINVQEPRDFSTIMAQDTVTSGGSGTVNSVGVPCIGDGTSGDRIQMVYAVASDQTDRYSQLSGNFQTWAGQMQNVLTNSAAKTGGHRYLRFATNPDCSVNVVHVTLSPTGDDSFTNTQSELQSMGYNKPNTKYIIWEDANVYCGISQIVEDSTAGPTNANNTITDYARIDSGCWARTDHMSEVHELIHALGGVQFNAPHATPNNHCTDEYDTLCYSDSVGVTLTFPCSTIGSSGSPVDTNPSSENLLDCNNDDYFNTNPAPGSYLTQYWNTANSGWLATSLTESPPPGDTTPPTAPANLTGNAPDSTHVNLSWNASSDETGGSGLAGYKIYRNGVPYQSLTTTTTTYIDTGVSGGTTYSYAVAAFDNSGNISTRSSSVSITTPVAVVPDTIPPVIVSISPAYGSTLRGKSATISATATDNKGVTYIEISVDGTIRASANTSTIKWNWNTSKVLRGAHTITAVAKDEVGNTTTTSIIVYK